MTAQDSQRVFPFVWTSWVTGLLSGDKQCHWAPWYRAHHFFARRKDPRGGNLEKWKSDHAAMVRTRVAHLRALGWRVWVEAQNKFTVRGKLAVLSACPDIVATHDSATIDRQAIRGMALAGPMEAEAVSGIVARVEDCKTGQPRSSDFWQVAIYTAFSSAAYQEETGDRHRPFLSGRRVDGAIVYGTEPDQIQQVSTEAVADVKSRIVDQIRETGGSEEPSRTPSFGECQYCDILACPDRITTEPQTGATEEF